MNLVSELANLWSAAVWRASWQAGLIVLLVWVVCRLAPSLPAWLQCWLWRLAILKFALAVVWSAPLELPLLPATLASPAMASEPTPAAPVAMAVTLPSPAELTPALSPLAILFVVWFALVAWQAARLALAFRATRQFRTSCCPSDDRQLVAELARHSRSMSLARPPALLHAAGQGSPLLLGVLHPAIVLPIETLERLDPAERSLVLGHELAHVYRRDLAWSLAAALVRSVFCFHPLAWLAERRLGLAQEIAADELAIGSQPADPLRYATLLVSIVGKLSPLRPVRQLSVGVTGSQQSLKQRLSAMRFIKPAPLPLVVVYVVALAALITPAIVPWKLVAANAPAAAPAKQSAEKQPAETPKSGEPTKPAAPKKDGTERGRLVSFKDNVLTIKINSGELIANPIPDSAQTLVWSDAAGAFQPADREQLLSGAKPNVWCMIHHSGDNMTIRVGSRKSQTVGTFVSYQDNRLLILGKNLGESYVKKYGNMVHFHRFRDDTPVYESIDGGEYKLVGTPGTVLGKVREGTIVTVHGQGDDNITLVQLGVPKQ